MWGGESTRTLTARAHGRFTGGYGVNDFNPKKAAEQTGCVTGRRLGSTSSLHAPGEATAVQNYLRPPGVNVQTETAPSAPALVSAHDCRLIDLPKIHDPQGHLTFIDRVGTFRSR